MKKFRSYFGDPQFFALSFFVGQNKCAFLQVEGFVLYSMMESVMLTDDTL